MTHDIRFLGLLIGILGGQLELWMHKLAVGSFRAESAEIIKAHDAARVPMPTIWTVPAKSSVVPRAIFDLGFGIDVKKRAFFVAARIEPRIEVALGHFGHVVFVQEFALVALLAQPAQPVLANDRPVPLDVPERASGAFAARAPRVELAHGGPRFVHPGEGERQSAELLFEGILDVEANVRDVGDDLLHLFLGPRLAWLGRTALCWLATSLLVVCLACVLYCMYGYGCVGISK